MRFLIDTVHKVFAALTGAALAAMIVTFAFPYRVEIYAAVLSWF